VSCAKTAEPIEMPVWVIDSGGPKEECIRWGPDPPCEEAIMSGKHMLGYARQHSAVSCAKIAEPTDLPFGLWMQVGRRKNKFNVQSHLPSGANVPSWEPWEDTLTQHGEYD